MVAYLSVPYSYLKGVQKTSRAWAVVKRGVKSLESCVEQSTVLNPHCERPEGAGLTVLLAVIRL